MMMSYLVTFFFGMFVGAAVKHAVLFRQRREIRKLWEDIMYGQAQRNNKRDQ